MRAFDRLLSDKGSLKEYDKKITQETDPTKPNVGARPTAAFDFKLVWSLVYFVAEMIDLPLYHKRFQKLDLYTRAVGKCW